MIAKDSGTGKSFAGLVNYLEHGKRGESQDRVAWFEGANLEVSSMREAAMVMRDSANQNSRVDKPVYHFSINWHADESHQVDQKMALEIAHGALQDVGLQNHQALIVAHKDTDHFHVHVVANRIDPDTGRAWTGSFSKVKLEQAMARLSLEHGFEVVPGHHNSLDLGIDPPAPENSQSTEALRFEERTETPSFDTSVRIELAGVFQDAETWAGLEQDLAERGFHLEARGRGLVVGNSEGDFAKASAIGREFSRSQLEERFGEAFPGASMMGEEHREPGVGEETEGAEARESLVAELKAASSWREYADVAESFGYELKAKGRGLVLTTDDEEIKSSALDRSLSKGRLEAAFGETFSEFEASDSTVIKLRQANAALSIEQAMTALENYDRAEAYAVDLFVERQEVMARTETSYHRTRRVSEARDVLKRTMGNLYKDGAGAMEAFDLKRRDIGTARAVKLLSESPKEFGATQNPGFMGIGGAEYKDAKASLRLAGSEYVAAVSDFGRHRETIDSELAERFDNSASKALQEAQAALKIVDRDKLVRDLLTASEAYSTKEVKELPFRTGLRGVVVAENIASLRDEPGRDTGRAFAAQRKGQGVEKWPRLPLDATPSEVRGFEAAERYAKARSAIRGAAPSLKAQGKVSQEMFSELRESAQALAQEGKGARRYYSRFKIDRRRLQADAGAGISAAARSDQRRSAFLRSKSPKIRIRFTDILRLLGVPIPRIPVPRMPRMNVKSQARGMVRELRR